MSIDIEAVLALLPELFPGTQQIPLKNIRPNPKNPGPPLIDPKIQDLSQNIDAGGLLNPIKLQPDRANPLVEGVQVHPDNPRLTAEGRLWAVGDFNYEILAGENRYRAFGHLKREAIPAFILNPTAKEAVKITHLDNEVRDRGWWAAYQTIEQFIQADPSTTLRQIGVELKMDNEKVYRALRLLPLLNTEARALIVRKADNSNKGILGILERPASQLAGLGPGSTLKPGVKKKDAPEGERQVLWPYPPIPAETQELVRRALEVAINQKMTEAEVKGLVEWVKGGNEPETYFVSGEGKPVRLPSVGSTSSPPVAQGEPEIVRQPEGLSMVGQRPTTTSLSPTAPIGAAPRNDGEESTQSPGTAPKPALGARSEPEVNSSNPSKGPAPLLQALIQKVGLGQSGFGKGAKSFLMGNLKRASGTLVRRWMVKGLVGMGAIVFLAPHLFVHLTSVGHPKSAFGSQKKENGPDPSRDSGEATSEHSEEALNFARDFYATEYLNTSHWMARLNGQLTKGYSEAFFKDFCPPERIVDINTQKLREEFYATAPVKFLGMGEGGDKYLVQGKAVLMSDLKDYGVTLTEGPVELEVHLVHEDAKVFMVTERLGLQLQSAVRSPQSAVKAQDKPAVLSPQSAVKAKDKPAARSPRLAAGEKKKAQAKATSKQSTALSPQSSVQEKQGDLLTKAVSQAGDEAAKRTGQDLGDKAADGVKNLLGF